MVLLPLALTIAAIVPPSTNNDAARRDLAVLYPPDKAVVRTGSVRLVLLTPLKRKAPVVTLEGKPVKLTRVLFGEEWMTRTIRRGDGPADRPPLLDARADAALWAAMIPLKPGRSALAIDGAKRSIFRSARADGRDAPAKWVAYSPHLALSGGTDARCNTCHVQTVKDGTAVLGGVQTPEACHACHADADLQLKHKHIMDILSRCWTCHDPHGSSHPKLLVDAKDTLCSRCHEKGHSK